MSDEASLTEGQADDAAGADEAHDWEKDYKELQAEYTRSQQALKDHSGVWDDEQALLARVQEKFPHLMAEEEEDTEDDDFEDDTPDTSQFATKKELEEFKTWRQSIDGERGEALYNQHLAEELGDRDLAEEFGDEVAKNARAWIRDRTMGLGGNRQALTQAVTEFNSLTGEKPKKPRKKAPHVPAGGKPGTGVKDWSQMSRDEQAEHMAEMVRASET